MVVLTQPTDFIHLMGLAHSVVLLDMLLEAMATYLLVLASTTLDRANASFSWPRTPIPRFLVDVSAFGSIAIILITHALIAIIWQVLLVFSFILRINDF